MLVKEQAQPLRHASAWGSLCGRRDAERLRRAAGGLPHLLCRVGGQVHGGHCGPRGCQVTARCAAFGMSAVPCACDGSAACCTKSSAADPHALLPARCRMRRLPRLLGLQIGVSVRVLQNAQLRSAGQLQLPRGLTVPAVLPAMRAGQWVHVHGLPGSLHLAHTPAARHLIEMTPMASTQPLAEGAARTANRMLPRKRSLHTWENSYATVS